MTTAGEELFFNIAAAYQTNAIVSGSVAYCTTGCAMFASVGATMTPADFPGVSLPGGGVSSDPAVSPVPLPPAMSLFAAALAMLAGLGFARQSAPQLQSVRRR